jgi:two-component system sensor histidine kinase HydH
VLFDRRILVQVTLPFVLVSLVFLAACTIGVWSINRLQLNRSARLTRNVRSLRAAQEMEVRLRQLRLHSLLYVMDPTPAQRAQVDADDHQFQEAYREAMDAAHLPRERELLSKIDLSYQLYRTALNQAPGKAPDKNTTITDILKWAKAHPVQHLLDTCEELVTFNRENRAKLAEESEAVSQQGRTALLLAGVIGPVGGLIGGFGVAWGLSRRMQEQQREVLRAEQLAAVGQLAASIAHEVRNPLTSIKLLVGAALRGKPAQPLTTEDLHVIHDEVSRLERKVQTLLDFARPNEAVRRPCDLLTIVQRALELVQSRLRQQAVQTNLDLPATPVSVEADPDQLTGVLVNLFLNALDAMPHGGQLSLTLDGAADGQCRLAVADTGPGIAPAVAGRLFTPFASTKPTGTGLGLSICRRVVQDHGGTLTGQNRPEGGACFTMTLPLHPTIADCGLRIAN